MNGLEHALQYAERGWPVFPCSPANKQPLVAGGFKSATDNADVIRRWWADNPDAMVGVPTGQASGVWVLDVDVKHGDGHGELAALEAEHGALPATITVRTPSGGQHYLFQFVDGVRNRGHVTANIDIRGEGGYVIAPGSVNADGQFYEWADTAPEPAKAPAWLLERVIKRGAKVENYAPSGPNTRYVEAAVADELSRLVRTTRGRNNALNDAAFALGTFVGAGALSASEAEARLFAAAVTNGYVAKDGEAAARATIASGLASGQADPRKIPEAEQGYGNDAERRMMAERGAALARSLLAGKAPTQAEVDQAVADAVQATPYVRQNPKTIPRREWLYARHYVRKYVSLTVAAGGAGKSTLAIAEALTMIHGVPLLGDDVKQRDLRVWYFNGEDDRDELARRIEAFCLRFHIPEEATNGRLFIDSGREQELVVMREVRHDLQIVEPIVDAIKRQIIANRIDVLIVDPFVSSHSVNENDNNAIDRVAKLWRGIAEECNCAIELVHHAKKVGDKEVEAEDSRGASALLAAARSVRSVNKMTTKQAEAAGVTGDDRFAHIYVTVVKSNLGAMSGKQTWRKIESVNLDNGTGIARPTDQVGVATPWQWPDGDEAARQLVDEVPAEITDAVLHRLGSGRFGQSENGQDWAGYAADAYLKYGTEKGEDGRARVKAYLAALVKIGRLRVLREKPTPSAPRERPYLVPAESSE